MRWRCRGCRCPGWSRSSAPRGMRKPPLGAAEPVLGPAPRGRTIWNVNSTAAGGGVAEMLQVLVGYTLREPGVDIRWLVIAGDAEFFAVTKRLHNRLHGYPGGRCRGSAGEPRASALRADTNRGQRRWPTYQMVRPRVTWSCCTTRRPPGWPSHSPRSGAHVVWRCHVGADRQNDPHRGRLGFPPPPPRSVPTAMSSHDTAYAPEVDPRRASSTIIPPSIDPLSPKNRTDQPAGRTIRSSPTWPSSGRGGKGTPTPGASATRPPRPRALFRSSPPLGQRGGRRASVASGRTTGGPGVPVGSPQGHARGDGGLRRARGAFWHARPIWRWSVPNRAGGG